MKLELTGQFTDGNLKIINRKQFESLTRGLNCDVDILITKRKKKRSSPQRRYYFGVIVAEIQQCLIESQGEFISKDDTHEFLKLKFNYKEIVNKKTGEIIQIAKSTTEQTTLEAEEYHDKIRDWADQFFNCIIPLPNEQKEMSL